jgi:DNA-binding MurR/RpiR family transcriptional regulator
VFLLGMGDDDVHVRAFALRLALLGILTVHSFDVVRMTSNVAAAQAGDVLVVISEFGQHAALGKIARQFRERRGQLVTLTRHTANPLRTLADIALVVSAHDEQPYIQSLLYQSAMQHLLDSVFVRLCEGHDDRHAQLLGNLERIQHILEP